MTRTSISNAILTTCVFSALVALCGCGEDDPGDVCPPFDASYHPVIDPASFVASVTHPLHPLVPGTTFVYAEGADRVEVTVLAETKTILGVTCTVVHDTHTSGGEIIEDTYDWFAQDASGAVWYFGEDTRELTAGVVTSTEGSWEAGVSGAQPGIIIPAVPTVGAIYRQEYLSCVAEDMGEVLSTSASTMVPLGAYTGCLQTRDFTPLDPELNENKYYCPGVGMVVAIDLVTGDREELVEIRRM